MKKVIVGGTFEILHDGHKALLKRGFRLGKVTIGLTSEDFAKRLKKREVKSYFRRKEKLERWVRKEFKVKAKIKKIDDIFGPTLKEKFDFIVVSPETLRNAVKINKERKKKGQSPIRIAKINFVLAEDGKPISCTRILRGEIDDKGKRCVFCRIIEGKKKVIKIYENKDFLAFLDEKPQALGHTLVIPKKHFRWVWDIPCLGRYFEVVGKVANSIRKAMKTDWVISPVFGGEVHHAHVHLIPRFEGESQDVVSLPKKPNSRLKMKKIAQKIKSFII